MCLYLIPITIPYNKGWFEQCVKAATATAVGLAVTFIAYSLYTIYVSVSEAADDTRGHNNDTNAYTHTRVYKHDTSATK